MAKTNVPAKLLKDTDGMTTEQFKSLEEAIQKQNSAINDIFKGLEEMKQSIDNLVKKPSEGISKPELQTAIEKYVSELTGQLAEILKKHLASFRGEVTMLRNERKAEHHALLDQRAHQHKVFIRIVIAIPAAVLLILFSSHYLPYRNSAVYWGNRAYNAAKAAGATNPGQYYQYVQEHFQDSLKKTARTNIRRLENTRSISQE